MSSRVRLGVAHLLPEENVGAASIDVDAPTLNMWKSKDAILPNTGKIQRTNAEFVLANKNTNNQKKVSQPTNDTSNKDEKLTQIFVYG